MLKLLGQFDLSSAEIIVKGFRVVGLSSEMIREEGEKDQAPGGIAWKNYSRSVSWTERPPRKSISKPLWNSKARSCLPPLQPLSIIRPNIEEWPRAGSDDLGVWPHPPTPGPKPGSLTPRENSASGEHQTPREFEFRKDKLAFFNKECSRILDHIYLGSDAIARDREILRHNRITHVLNCVGFVCPEYFKNELKYKTLWLKDCPSEDITSILYDVFDYFEDVKEQNGRVLVHCCQGVSRSTSLVIAYLMWKEGHSFNSAFQLVKAARGVTNPNVGFACQLLQCQKRVHALPASPSSVLRMYRMAPHSPYDPLHLVPKMVSEPGPGRLDSRGAFIVHVPSALYVWIGKQCSLVMLDNARAAASQVIRYERAEGPVITVKEGEETFGFWDDLGSIKVLTDELDRRKISEYDMDFEIFRGALSGGVVPPFPLSEAESEMCLPARENGWNRLRRKLAIGVVKEFITSSKLKIMDTCKEVEDCISPDNLSSDRCDSQDLRASYVTGSPRWTENSNLKDTSLSRSPSFSLVDSFLLNKTKSSSTSPSLSPATSDYSSSFTFSPSSSNWSDLSFVSAQPSLYGLESNYVQPCKDVLEESITSGEENAYSLDNATSPPVRRSNIMILPSIDEASRISENLTRYLEDDIMRDAGCNHISSEFSNSYIGDDDVLSRLPCEKKYDTFRASDDIATNKISDTANIVFYQWPSMHRIDMHSGILDSGSVYIILLPGGSVDTTTCDVLYVWIGRNVSSEEDSYSRLIGNDEKCADVLVHLEKTFDRDLLVEKGFNRDSHVKIVKEGEEPKQLLEHISRLLLNKDLGEDQRGGGIK